MQRVGVCPRMKHEQNKSLRLTKADTAALLDRLDGGDAGRDPNARRSTRYRYRVHAAVEFPDQNRMVTTAVACRDGLHGALDALHEERGDAQVGKGLPGHLVSHPRRERLVEP